MHAEDKSFGMWSVIRGEIGAQFFVWGDIQQKWKVQIFGLAGRRPQFPPLVEHPDLPIRKTLRRVLGLFTVMILKIVSGSISF